MSQKQGIQGKVVWVAGNQMPGPGKKHEAAKGIVREIQIYEPVTMQQVKNVNGFYTDIKTRLVAKVNSNSDGTFTVNLPPGEYSVFTKEDEGLFASVYDGQGRINVIEVKKGDFKEVTLQVNYQAAY